MTFYDYPPTLGTAPVTNGKATITTQGMILGPHFLGAVYSGDAKYAGSTAPAQVQTVVKATTTIQLTSPVNPAYSGQAVTVTATISSALATGTVTFTEGSTNLGVRTLTGGSALLSTSTLSPGSHAIAAAYGGDAHFLESTSAVLVETIIPGTATAVAITSSASSSTLSQPVTLTAMVSPAGAAGKVNVYDGPNVLGTVPGSAGQATFTTSQLPFGLRSLRAHYSGSGPYSPSTSTATTIKVTALPVNGFTPETLYPLSQIPKSAIVADFNGDGKPDLATVVGTSVTILLGNGDGSFQPPLSYDLAVTVSGIAAADFNGDGKTDLVVSVPAGIEMLLGNGDETSSRQLSRLPAFSRARSRWRISMWMALPIFWSAACCSWATAMAPSAHPNW